MNTATKTRTTFLTIEHPLESVAHKGIWIAVGLMVLLYLYLVSASVFNVIASKEANSKAAHIEGAVGMLEQQYLALSQYVTPETGTTIGLAPLEAPVYVVRPTSVGMVDTTVTPN